MIEPIAALYHCAARRYMLFRVEDVTAGQSRELLFRKRQGGLKARAHASARAHACSLIRSIRVGRPLRGLTVAHPTTLQTQTRANSPIAAFYRFESQAIFP